MKREHRRSRRSLLRVDAHASGRGESFAGIHVAGVVVMTRRDSLPRVRAALGRLSGAEIHAVDPCGKLVITLEAPSDEAIADLLTHIPAMPGVLSCTLAHHHSEDPEVFKS